jgi:hypothetical protein
VTRYISTFPALPITWECTIVWEARDPVTDDPVSGVVIDSPVLYGLNLTEGEAPVAPTTLATPLWIPIPIEDQPEEGS